MRRNLPLDKSMESLIKENRNCIDAAIERVLNRHHKPGDERILSIKTDHERRLWILNDEGLYNWARSEGVRI